MAATLLSLLILLSWSFHTIHAQDPVLPPIEIEEEEEPEFYTVVEQMPRFPGCEDKVGNNKAKKACADQKLLKFLYENIKYPPLARENHIEGMIAVSFIVMKDGGIDSIKTLRNPGGGWGEEIVRVISLMNKVPQKWTPSFHEGKPVRVKYILPIRFKPNF